MKTVIFSFIFFISGCATASIPMANSIPCQALKTISYSAKSDSTQTVIEVREYNAVYKDLCH